MFRNRGWLPLLFLAVPLLAPGDTSPRRWVIGGLLVAIGEAVRLAGVAAAGTVTRRRSRNVQRLVTYGIFSWVRNPLYVGNFLAWMGFTVISGVLWFLPVAAVVFAIEYTLIVRYEEGVLETIFRNGRAPLGRGMAKRDQHATPVRRAHRGICGQGLAAQPLGTLRVSSRRLKGSRSGSMTKA